MEKKKILIVDDEQEMRFTLSLILKRKGYVVEATNNGLKALDIVKEKKNEREAFDMVVCDLQAPHMNGERLLASLKEMNIYLPLLIITSRKELFQKLLEDESCDYLDKPFNQAELEKKMKKLFAAAELKKNLINKK